MLEFQPWTIFFTVVNLLVLYFFFRKFLFGRVNAVLAQREELIRTQIEQAEQQNVQAQASREKYENALAGAKKEAAALLTDAKGRAEDAYKQRMAQAEDDAKRILQEAQERIAAQRGEMLRAARSEVVDLAVLAASEVAGKRLDTDTDRALAQEFLESVGEQA